METMKDDMGGAASILATMKVIAQLKPKINVIAAIPCSENMPSGSAQKPGDVITHRGGTTSEVLNTDAEGRLILADALAYLAEKKPACIVDTATLTGACMVALGTDITGAFGNDDVLAQDLVAAGAAVGEPIWQMPLWGDYRPLIDSKVADIKNVGKRYGGAITAAWFLAEFVGDTPWVHLDIAGPAFVEARDGSRSGGRHRRAGADARAVRPRSRGGVAAVTEERPIAPTGPVLAVFAHPDDAEICAGGVLAKWAAAGREVHLLVLTNGDRGSGDPAVSRAELAATRSAETEAAATVMGLASVRILSTHDGELENTAAVREAVVRRVREVQAESMLSCDPTAVFFEGPNGGSTTYYNHADHRNAGLDRAGLRVPRQRESALLQRAPGRGPRGAGCPRRVARVDERAQPHVDVSGSFRTKIDALAAHASQLAEGIRFFEDFLSSDARAAGEKIGVEYAEEFRVLDLS